jgi:cephalosporin-C deacetylase-like acetyl esterase
VKIRAWQLGMWLALLAASLGFAEPSLPGTSPLQRAEPLDEVMVDGIRKHALRELQVSPLQRARFWNYDFTSLDAFEKSLAPNRARLEQILGAVDPRTSLAKGAGFELIGTPSAPPILAASSVAAVFAVRWPVLEGVTGEGLLVVPHQPKAAVVALPDAAMIPERFVALDKYDDGETWVKMLAATGSVVLVPTLIDRGHEWSGHPEVGFTDQPHREFLYRQAFEMGRHPIGYEVQKVRAALDLLERFRRPEVSDAAVGDEPDQDPRRLPLGVSGVGEGAMIALCVAALDTRVQATMISGHFGPREGLWAEPIYRNVWGLLREFGDAELASMLAARHLTIQEQLNATGWETEESEVEEVLSLPNKDPEETAPGRASTAAPGHFAIRKISEVKHEFEKVAVVFKQLENRPQLRLDIGDNGWQQWGEGSGFLQALKLVLAEDSVLANFPAEQEDDTDGGQFSHNPRERHRRQFQELQDHVQRLMEKSHRVRNARWLPPQQTREAWGKSRAELRDLVLDSYIGRLPHDRLPPRSRSRVVRQTEQYTAYEVELDVMEGVIAGGILLVPTDLKPDERRPVVVCQHGLESLAIDTLALDGPGFQYYKGFAHKLAGEGFVVYAPQNPYRGEDRFRVIQRMANPLGRSLFSYIIAQHEQTVAWLQTLPFAQPEKIGFYGLSYGGKTAMRVPPFVEGYALAICSGDFTDWARTITTNEERYGYAFTREYEIPEWNLGHIASYAELASLMFPRPFMVEQGHQDGGAPSEWVLGEFGKVRRMYDHLGESERCHIEFFDGPHTIHGVDTFEFLRRWLR